jgi:hypothetical protein
LGKIRLGHVALNPDFAIFNIEMNKAVVNALEFFPAYV